jgi:predicted Zn-dependent protease
MRSCGAVLAATILFSVGNAKADVFKPSQQEQIRLGLDAANQLRRQEKVLPSTDPRVKLLRHTAEKILASIHDKAGWHWSFDVVESREINAFALPGGPTFFYTGLIDKLKTEDELAAVLGHEMTHVRREHWAHAYADQQERSLGLAVLLGVVHANNDVYNFTGMFNSMLTLRYSRRDESQADDGGFDLMSTAGYNPQGMANVFQMLQDSEKGGAPPEFLSDHPSDKNRINHIETRIKESGQTYPALTPLPFEAFAAAAAAPAPATAATKN